MSGSANLSAGHVTRNQTGLLWEFNQLCKWFLKNDHTVNILCGLQGWNSFPLFFSNIILTGFCLLSLQFSFTHWCPTPAPRGGAVVWDIWAKSEKCVIQHCRGGKLQMRKPHWTIWSGFLLVLWLIEIFQQTCRHKRKRTRKIIYTRKSSHQPTLSIILIC